MFFAAFVGGVKLILNRRKDDSFIRLEENSISLPSPFVYIWNFDFNKNVEISIGSITKIRLIEVKQGFLSVYSLRIYFKDKNKEKWFVLTKNHLEKNNQDIDELIEHLSKRLKIENN